jgi:pimeloyl-ACP methyl ester carboxylesterase
MKNNMKERHFQLIETNGIRLRSVVEGKGPLVILLHGFPQCWYLWRHQIDPLVEAGFQVAAPDQRGYGGSDRPAEIEAYNIIELTNDVVGLADALGHERFISSATTGARRSRGTRRSCIHGACARSPA